MFFPKKEKKKTSVNFFSVFFYKKYIVRGKGFSLIELLVVIGIIAILASIIMPAVRIGREKANVVAAGLIQRQMTIAVELYRDDVGFYPPDVNRGWDPGFMQPLPWNPDAAAGEPPPPGSYSSPGTNCSHCPPGWETLVQLRWGGPYMSTWPRFTPWGGKYDYNYWGSGATRSGCTVLPGVYVGVQGDYDNNNTIPQSAEEKMITQGFDTEGCLNGESQMVLEFL